MLMLTCALPAWAANDAIPRWSSDRHHRVVVKVDPVAIGSLAADEMVAAVEIDFTRHTGGQHVDPSSLQIVGYDPQTGEPVAYAANPWASTTGEHPFRFYDAAIPWDFSEGEGYAQTSNGTGQPARILAGGGRYLGVVGEGCQGKIAWNHVQRGARPSYYAIYFNSQPTDAEQKLAPAGFVGDGSNRCGPESPQFFPLYHSRVDTADVNDDGLFDLVVGNMNGTIMIYPNVGTRQQARFRFGSVVLTDEGRVLDIGYSSAPKAVDWDQDGDLDLIVGAEKESFVFFRNIGTAAVPKFHFEGLLKDSDGKAIRVPKTPCEEDPEGKIFPYDYYPIPEVVDWDGDGDLDLIVGGYITGRVWLYENVAASSKEVPKLKFRGALQADGKDVDVTWMAAPTVADFDGDGDLDLVSGAMQITKGGGDKADPERFLWYYQNIGTRSKPELTLRSFPARGRFKHGLLGTPRAVDFNGDGLLDLVVSASMDLLLVPNIGTADKPLFDASVKPIPGSWSNDPLRFEQLVDYNGDGWPDLFREDVVLLNDPARPGWFQNAREIRLLSSGSRIHHPSPRGDAWGYLVLADLDGDNKFDILVGTHEGHVWFHRDRGPEGKPDIDPEGVQLTLTNGELMRVGMPPSPADGNTFDELQGARTTMDVADFNRDGLADLLVCDAYGVIRLFLREPGKELRFGPGANLARLVHIRLTARAMDWNGDGWEDILATYAGSQTYLLLNRGVSDQAQFQEPVEIKVPEYPMSWPLLHVADWNGDGDTDLIFNYFTMVRFVERSFIDHGYIAGRIVSYQHKGEQRAAASAKPTFERITVASTGPYAYNAFPTVDRLSDNRLLCVFSVRSKPEENRFAVAGSFSEDHGRTWSNPEILIDSPNELDYDPNLIVVGSRVIVTSTTCPLTHQQFISTSRTLAVRSEDSGRTWSKPYEIPMGHRFAAGKIHKGLVLEDGTALFGYSWDAALEGKAGKLKLEGDHDLVASLMRSSDRGLTWQGGSDVFLRDLKRDADRIHAINGLDEPALVQLHDGTLYMLCRTGLAHPYETRSADGGKTWSRPEPCPLTGHNAPVALCRINGARPGMLTVWCNSSEVRWPLCVAASFDNARSWTPPRELARREGFESSYPGCVQAADGTLVVVWQQALPDGQRAIDGARMNVDWLLGPSSP